MRRSGQKLEFENMVKSSMENVKRRFPCIYSAIEFGAYIQPENYFVSYIFRTDAILNAAQQSGLTEEIKMFHRRQLRENAYPVQGIKDCIFASQEDCDRECNGNWYYYYK